MTDDSLEKLIQSGNYCKAERRIVLIGKTGVGKSSTCNTILGRDVMKASVGASSITKECREEMTTRGGRTVQVVDTPGFFDTQVDNEIRTKITQCVAMSAPGPHAIVLVIRVGRFTEEDRSTVDQIKKWFGADMVKNMLIVFTGQDDLEEGGVDVAKFLADSPVALTQILTQASNRYLTVNNRASAEHKEKFAQDLLQKVDEVVSANNGTWYTTEQFRKAQEEIKRKEEAEMERKRQELKRQRDDIEQTIKAKYSKMMSEQDQQLQKLSQELSNLQVIGQQNNVQFSDKVNELNAKVTQAQQKRAQLNADRDQWEKNLLNQTSMSEAERSAAMKSLKDKLDASVRQKEEEVRQFAVLIENERITREQEMNRRAEERRQQQAAEHAQRVAAIEAERRAQEERNRQEKIRMAEQERVLEQQRQQAEADARRRRHRHRNDCTVS